MYDRCKPDFNDRFWLFYVRYYYPNGGLNDICITDNSLKVVELFYENNNKDMDTEEYGSWYIFDKETGIYMKFKEYCK